MSKPSPDALRKAIAPYRTLWSRRRMDLSVGLRRPVGAGGLALSWARPVSASDHGGQTKTTRWTPEIARLLARHAPQAYVSPAALRATRDLLRRRTPEYHTRGVARATSQYQ